MGPDPEAVEKVIAKRAKTSGGMAPSPERMNAQRNRKVVVDTTSKKAQDLRRVTHALWFKGGTQLLTWLELMLANDRQFEIARHKILDELNQNYRELAAAIDIVVDGPEQE